MLKCCAKFTNVFLPYSTIFRSLLQMQLWELCELWKRERKNKFARRTQERYIRNCKESYLSVTYRIENLIIKNVTEMLLNYLWRLLFSGYLYLFAVPGCISHLLCQNTLVLKIHFLFFSQFPSVFPEEVNLKIGTTILLIGGILTTYDFNGLECIKLMM